MFDPKEHYIDTKGFARDKKTNHLLGIEERPVARHPDEGAEYPKWVAPHPGHVKGAGDSLSTPLFPQHHINRVSGDVTVLVHTAAEAALAAADPNAKPAAPNPPQK